MGKRLWALLAAALLYALSPAALAAEGQDGPAVSAKAAVVMDADSGRTIYEKQPDAPMLIASTTKLMTALVVLERCPLDREVTVDAAWTGIEGSSMYLSPGQTLTVEELLYGLLLASGNDAAVALACTAAGSEEAFAGLMNETAAALGCENTHFVNASGLDGEGHFSCARDLAKIMGRALDYDAFRQIVSAQSKAVAGHTYVNHNRLLRECPGVFGGKTGYTKAAGRTLVSCCKREGLTLICVTLSDPDDWADHRALYDWAYESYVRCDVLEGRRWSVPVMGGVQESVSASAEGGLFVLCRPGEPVEVRYRLPGFVYAPVYTGGVCGEAAAYVDGQEAGRARIVYETGVDQAPAAGPGFWTRLGEFFQ